MDIYWELSDFNIHTRQQGMEKLLKSLRTLSANDDNEKVQQRFVCMRILKFSLFFP